MYRTLTFIGLIYLLLAAQSGNFKPQKPEMEDFLRKFYELANKGQELSLKNSCDSAANYYYQAFLVYDGFPDYLNVFISAELKSTTPKVNRLKMYFKKSAEDFGAIQNYFFTDTPYVTAIPEELVAYVNANKDQWQRNFQSGVNLEKLRILNNFVASDQFVRDRDRLLPKDDSSLVDCFESQDVFNDYQKSLMREIDSRSREYVLTLLENDHFPLQNKELGVNGFYSFILLVHHCFHGVKNDSLRAEYENYFTKAFNQGLMSNWQYATTIDYVFSWDFHDQKKKLKYWLSPPFYDHFIRDNMEIYEVENLDNRRKEIGLMPLWKEAQLRGKFDQLPDFYLKTL